MLMNKPPMHLALLFAALLNTWPILANAAEKDDEKNATDNDARVCEDCPNPGVRSGSVEAGIGLQSRDSAHFGRYSGRESQGATLELNGELEYRDKLNTGAYVNGEFVDIGLESRRLSVEGGRQGKYSLSVEYDELPNYRKAMSAAALSTQRDRTGVKFSIPYGKTWELTGHARHENKDGVRDIGVLGEVIAVPVDYTSDDFGLAFGYQGERLSAQISYEGAVFKNGSDQFSHTLQSAPLTETIAEAPDNEFHQLGMQAAYHISDSTQVNASLAMGRGRSTLLSLPSGNLEGELSTTQAKLDINSRPTARLRMDASYTYNDRDNDTPMVTYVGDGVFDPPRMNKPYGFSQHLLRMKAGYRINNQMDVSGGFDNNYQERTYLRTVENEEQTVWVNLNVAPTDELNATLKLSHADREGTSYQPGVQFLPNVQINANYQNDPALSPLMFADRVRDLVGVDVDYQLNPNLSLSLTADYNLDDYKNTVLGLNEARGYTLMPGVSFNRGDHFTTTFYYSYEHLKSRQNGRESGVVPTADWAVMDTNRTQTVGMNVEWQAIPDKLKIGADIYYSSFTGKIAYAGGGDLPNLNVRVFGLGANGAYALKKNTTLRAGYRLESYREADWANVNWSSDVTLGVWPEKERTHFVYLSVRYAFE
jgi:MtrB/PioB family decaheme-associated outer membrane protein